MLARQRQKVVSVPGTDGDGDAAFEFLMMERSQGSTFLPGGLCFPGPYYVYSHVQKADKIFKT
jgi:hypothetical protein